APVIGGEIGIPLDSRLDLVLGGRYRRSDARSEYRDFVDQDDLPIVQDTRLKIAPLTAGLRYNLVPTGRRISNYAWVPAAFVPYAGAAVGLVYYNWEQEGDFIDEADPDLPVYNTFLQSNGWTKTAHLFAGADFRLSPRLLLGLDGRYQFGRAELDPMSYDGYEPIDLSGFWLSVALTARF